MAPPYLATLPTTGSVLSALRSAHAARLAVTGGGNPVPVAHRGMKLASLSAFSAGFSKLMHIKCQEAAFSADGQYLAVQVHSVGWVRDAVSGHNEIGCVSGIAVLKAAEGFRELCCIRTKVGQREVRWAPDAPHLCIAVAPREDQLDPASFTPTHSDVCVLDLSLHAESGCRLHALGAETVGTFRQACVHKGKLGGTAMEWDRSGRLLLVSTQDEPEEPDDQVQGVLSVFDVAQDALLAQSAYTAVEAPRCQIREIAVWLPNSQGLVVSHGVRLFKAEAFAGKFGLAFLPEPCYLVNALIGAAFFPGGQQLVARMRDVDSDNDWDSDRDDAACDHCFLECQVEGLQVTLSQAAWVFKGHGWSWLPCSSGVVLGMVIKYDGAQQSQIVYCGNQQQHTLALPGQTPALPMFFSPSQQIVVVNGAKHGPRIHSLQSGSQLWAAGTAIPRWHHNSTRARGAKYRCVAFLPSGCGLMCAGSIAGRSRYRQQEKLHIFSFA